MPHPSLDKTTTTLITLYRIDARDGSVYAFAAHTEPVIVDGVTYVPAPLDPTEIERRAGLAADNAELDAVIASNLIEADVIAGKLAGARLTILLYDYQSASVVMRHVGYLGEITLSSDGQLRVEYRSLAQLFSQQIGDLTSPTCRVRDLGDAECKVNLANFTHVATVTTVTDRTRFSINVSKPDGYFRYGRARFLTGANANTIRRIQSHTANTIELVLATVRDIQPGDQVELIAGCDRTRETCRDKFANMVNFRGEPDLPGLTKVLKFPE
jgi:uncharacterized phage protein (TIGR02218 family)